MAGIRFRCMRNAPSGWVRSGAARPACWRGPATTRVPAPDCLIERLAIWHSMGRVCPTPMGVRTGSPDLPIDFDLGSFRR
jgi:hypothetical protein